MPIVAKLDELGKGAWIALMVLGFVAWWPLGLATLAFILGSGRIRPFNRNGMCRWQGQQSTNQRGPSVWWPQASSGNRAFDDYRADTLRRLEDEQREFREFLERLRQAKDKSEFDQFMADRGRRTDGPQTIQT